MFLLIEDYRGQYRVKKKSDIREVYTDISGATYVRFIGSKNPPIRINQTPSEFYNANLKRGK